MIHMLEVASDIECSVQLLSVDEAFDMFVLRDKGFEIVTLLPDPHRIPLNDAIGFLSR
jgi:hypothetical protein